MVKENERKMANFVKISQPALWCCIFLALIVNNTAAVNCEELAYQRITDNYHVKTDISDEFADIAAGHMEAIYREYRFRFPEYDRKGEERFTVKIFQNRQQYNAVIPPEVKGSGGAFIPQDLLLAVFKGDNTQEQVLRTLYHEGFHQFRHEYIGTHVPLWVDEGFAEYFAEAHWTGRRFATGQIPWQRLSVVQSAIKKHDYVPLKDLFLVEHDEWLADVREQNTQANLQYNQAWSVVHFLVHARSGRFRERLFSYLQALSEGKERAEAFRESFGENIDSMERAWKEYVTGLTPDNLSLSRLDMELILFIAASFYDSPRDMKSIKEFVEDIFENTNLEWSIQAPNGENITSDDRERLQNMLRCPEDRVRKGVSSYILLHNPGDGLPELYNIHYDGILIKAYLVRRDSQWISRSEVVVREMVSPGLQRALRRAVSGL